MSILGSDAKAATDYLNAHPEIWRFGEVSRRVINDTLNDGLQTGLWAAMAKKNAVRMATDKALPILSAAFPAFDAKYKISENVDLIKSSVTAMGSAKKAYDAGGVTAILGVAGGIGVLTMTTVAIIDWLKELTEREATFGDNAKLLYACAQAHLRTKAVILSIPLPVAAVQPLVQTFWQRWNAAAQAAHDCNFTREKLPWADKNYFGSYAIEKIINDLFPGWDKPLTNNLYSRIVYEAAPTMIGPSAAECLRRNIYYTGTPVQVINGQGGFDTVIRETRIASGKWWNVPGHREEPGREEDPHRFAYAMFLCTLAEKYPTLISMAGVRAVLYSAHYTDTMVLAGTAAPEARTQIFDPKNPYISHCIINTTTYFKSEVGHKFWVAKGNTDVIGNAFEAMSLDRFKAIVAALTACGMDDIVAQMLGKFPEFSGGKAKSDDPPPRILIPKAKTPPKGGSGAGLAAIAVAAALAMQG